jgi:hypothetical protein
MTSDLKAPTPDEAIGRSEARGRTRSWRVLASTGALVLMLGAGWVAGIKTQETMNVAQISSTAWTQVATLGGFFQSAGTRIVVGVRNLVNWTATPSLATASPTPAGAEGDVERITGKIDQVRASSEAAVEGVRGTVDRLVSSMESSHRHLVTKLEDLRERLDRVERNGPMAAGPVLTKLEQMNERLDRLERSAAVALMPTQALALTGSQTPAPKQATGVVQASAPSPATSPSEKPPQAPAATKKIPEWVVREVVNGQAILQGPRGLIGVSTGDLVPGVGRVQSIVRQGGRWIVATNKGVISAR